MMIPSQPLSLETLPIDVILSILSHLDISSIIATSRISKTLSQIACSDTIWREISKRLIGPWIHQNNSSLSFNSQSSSDWTVEVKYFPLHPQPETWPSSSENLSTNHHRGTSPKQPICSWYDLAIQFLLPNAAFLGWHMSSQKPHGKLVLVTFDVKSCRILAEEVVCYNAYDRRIYSTQGLSQSSLNQGLRNVLWGAQAPDLPSWMPLNQISISHPSGDQYMINQGVQSPHSSFNIDIFTPLLFTLPWFTISPFSPHCSLTKVQDQLCSATLALSITSFSQDWEEYIGEDINKKINNSSKLLLSKSEIKQQEILSEFSIIFEGEEKKKMSIHAFFVDVLGPKISFNKAPSNSYLGARIRYQATPTQSAQRSLILAGGRTYKLGGSEVSQDSGTSQPSTTFYSIEGPELFGKRSINGLEGMWVGCYGSHGCEFGKVLISAVNQNSGEGERKFVEFIKLTGDENVPMGEVSWRAALNQSQFPVVTREEAVQYDFGSWNGGESKWLAGKGRVALHGFREPFWIDILVQGVIPTDNNGEEVDPLSLVNEIRVKWVQLQHISTFCRC